MSSKTLIAIIVVTVASTLLGTKILTLETHKGQHEEVHSENEEVHDGGKEPHKGPHGGWLFGTDFQLELKIFETGSPPRFRAFGYHRKRTIPPEDLRVEVDLSRLGEPRETFLFRVLDDYLVADAIVREPHSFEMQIRAFHEKELYQWEHSQVEGRVELTPESAKYAGVDIEVADARVMNIHLKLPGEIHFNEDRLTHVVPRIEGVVSKVLKRQGERVEKGDVLAVVESREMAEMRGSLRAALRLQEMAKSTFEREERLWKQRKSAQQDFLEARQKLAEAEINRDVARQKLLALGLKKEELAGSQSEEYTQTSYEVRAPQAGTVVEKEIVLGESLKADSLIYTIADLRQLWGRITVYARDLPNVQLGQKVHVKSPGLELATTGRISYIGSTVGRDTQSVEARVLIPNEEGLWRPGLFASMSIQTATFPVSIAVLRSAVQTYRDTKAVFGRFGKFFEVRPVTLGRHDELWVEVTSGLRAGQSYASTNSFVLKADLEKSGATHDH